MRLHPDTDFCTDASVRPAPHALVLQGVRPATQDGRFPRALRAGGAGGRAAGAASAPALLAWGTRRSGLRYGLSVPLGDVQGEGGLLSQARAKDNPLCKCALLKPGASGNVWGVLASLGVCVP